MRKLVSFALCLWLVVVLATACDSAQSAPSPVVPTPAKGQDIAQATSMATLVITATNTLASTATSTLTKVTSVTPSLVPTPTATQSPSITPSPKWKTTMLQPDGSRLPALNGKVVSFQNSTLKIEVEPGITFNLLVNEATAVYAGVSALSQVVGPSQAAAFNAAVKESARVNVGYRDALTDTAVSVMLTLSKEALSALPTVPPQTQSAILNATRVHAPPTSTPPGFQATSTPVLAHRIAEFPWGKVDLDIPLAEANAYATMMWCARYASWIPPEKLPLYPTQPQAMVFGAGGGTGYFHNVEIVSRDAAWKTAPTGARYLQAIGLIRKTQDKNDTRKIALTVYEGAPLLVFFPMDARAMGGFGVEQTGNGREQTFIQGATVTVSTLFAVTDPNQIRVGQIYGLFESADIYHHPTRSLITEFTATKSDPWIFQPGSYSSAPYHALVIYTQSFDWLGACDHFVKDLGLVFDPADWRW